MATTEVTTSIREVLGHAPFERSSNYVHFRATARGWLRRLGWSQTAAEEINADEFRRAYKSFDALKEVAAKYKQPEPDMQRAIAAAEKTYVSRNSTVILRVQQLRKQNTQIPPAAPQPVAPAAPVISREALQSMVREELAKQKPVEVIVKVMSADKVAKVEGVVHPKLPIIAKAMASRMTNGFHPNIWLGGQTGSGKSHVVEQIAKAMKLKFYVHGAMSMVHELMGYKDANGKYHTTPFRQAFEFGGVVLLDECDSWDPAVTLALNGPLANNLGAFADGMVARHKDCIVVAAGNTFGAGATSEFVGRNRLDAAFMSRFAVKVQMERDPRIELAIAGGNAEWVKRVTEARARAAANGIKHLIDPRHSQAGAALIAAGMTMDEAAELTYLAGLPEAQRRTIEGI